MFKSRLKSKKADSLESVYKKGKNIMKKIIVFLMAAIMCVGFFSCGESSVDKFKKEVATEATTVKEVDFEALYNSIKTKYKTTFDNSFWKFDSLVYHEGKSDIRFVMLTQDSMYEFTVDELNAYADMIEEITDFTDENQQVLVGTIKETEFGNIYYIRVQKEE